MSLVEPMGTSISIPSPLTLASQNTVSLVGGLLAGNRSKNCSDDSLNMSNWSVIFSGLPLQSLITSTP